jgi:hypothetical protein
MIRVAILAFGFLLSAPLLAADKYGGDEKQPCPAGKTGYFYLYKDACPWHDVKSVRLVRLPSMQPSAGVNRVRYDQG